MPAAPVSPVEPDRVADVKPLKRPAQTPLWRLHDQMIMIRHQYVGVEAQFEARTALAQQFHKSLPIPVRSENRSPLVPPRRQMIPRPRELHSQRSRHCLIKESSRTGIKLNVECRDVTPFDPLHLPRFTD